MLKIGELKKNAKAQLSPVFGLTIGALLVSSIITGLATGTAIAGFILGGVFEFGLVSYCLNVKRGNDPKIANIFDGFSRFGATCVAGMLTTVFTALWSLLLIFPGIIKKYAYSMTQYIIKDHPELSGSEAIDISKKMMKGKKGKLFLLDLSFIGWWLLSILTFGLLAILYVGPYYRLTVANFYEEARKDFEQASGLSAKPDAPTEA